MARSDAASGCTGPFPAMTPTEDGGSVRGEIFAARDDVLERLDRIEGVPTFYRRLAIRVRGDDGGECSAWAYLMRERDIDGRPRIQSGDWLLRTIRPVVSAVRATRAGRQHTEADDALIRDATCPSCGFLRLTEAERAYLGEIDRCSCGDFPCPPRYTS